MPRAVISSCYQVAELPATVAAAVTPCSLVSNSSYQLHIGSSVLLIRLGDHRMLVFMIMYHSAFTGLKIKRRQSRFIYSNSLLITSHLYRYSINSLMHNTL